MRTKANLRTIEASKRKGDNPDIYEVTQPINSMLGLIVFPQQSYVDSIPETPFDELRKHGWPINETRGRSPANNLRIYEKNLRNAIAHANLEFTTDGHQLTGANFWNTSHTGEMV